MVKKSETIVIGGGFYGLSVALYLRDHLNIKDIIVFEKETTMMSRASYVNQARVHNGYHYPRSILTAYRSAANFSRFVDDYRPAIINDFDKYYAISRVLSKVNSRQFVSFAHKIGTEIKEANDSIADLFNKNLIEGVYSVKEYGFNSHILRDILLERVKQKPGITIYSKEEVDSIKEIDGIIGVVTNKDIYYAKKVLNCTYSQINNLHRKSNLPLVSLKHEVTEMALVSLPKGFEKFSITIMDGPFFSIMPFPSKGLYTLSHVRYTPHYSWLDDGTTEPDFYNAHQHFSDHPVKTQYKKMHADVVRYIPALKDMKYVESISEVKTVLQKSENDDSRPILFKPHFGIRGYACIMGGKLDNIYDVFEEIKQFYVKDQGPSE